ncbi:unnamed protein product [Blepharisma stoltei]|uniref:Uncharacterized protein n=1 Tax=Blepharisma stoltei TaxID=1481888 RepID=A0AAU9IS33_9CILI|nr:unnamed protein product [Blepharisma stoltei]
MESKRHQTSISLLGLESKTFFPPPARIKSKKSQSLSNFRSFFKSKKDHPSNENFPSSELFPKTGSEISKKSNLDNHTSNPSSEIIIECTHEYTRIFNNKLSEMMDYHKETILKLINDDPLDGNQDF